MQVLILGGTTEARALARALAERGDVDVILSLAGRTSSPRDQGVPTRIGGFGGAGGLARTLRDESVDLLIDATHPFADRISANAADAARATHVPLLAVRRPAWEKRPGDTWIDVGTVAESVEALGTTPVRAFLALGRNDIGPFASADRHFYLVRSVDPVDPPLDVPNAVYITARGPFTEHDDRALLQEQRIDVIVAKNSGGDATYGKIAAARALRIPVVMLRRPRPPAVETVKTVEAALAWVDHALTLAAARGV